MQVTTISLTLPKAGNSSLENEDAVFPYPGRKPTKNSLRFTMSDGATEGMLSGRWAQLVATDLHRHWVDKDHLSEWLQDVYGDWARSKQAYIQKREFQKRPIQWYEEPGLEQGAFATLLGVSLSHDEYAQQDQFEVIALGDSCFFQVRAGNLVYTFPLRFASDFSNRPVLLASNPARNGKVLEHFKLARGSLALHDRLYLMTDALSAWFFRAYEAGNSPWMDLDRHANHDNFAIWIDSLRQARQIRNDDVTLTRIEITDL